MAARKTATGCWVIQHGGQIYIEKAGRGAELNALRAGVALGVTPQFIEFGLPGENKADTQVSDAKPAKTKPVAVVNDKQVVVDEGQVTVEEVLDPLEAAKAELVAPPAEGDKDAPGY